MSKGLSLPADFKAGTNSRELVSQRGADHREHGRVRLVCHRRREDATYVYCGGVHKRHEPQRFTKGSVRGVQDDPSPELDEGRNISRKEAHMNTRTLLPLSLFAVFLSAYVNPTAAYSADLTPVASLMVREAVPAVEAYRYDHGTYAGVTVAKLRLIDTTVSSVEVVRPSRRSYCLQVNVLGSWAHYRPGLRRVVAGRC